MLAQGLGRTLTRLEKSVEAFENEVGRDAVAVEKTIEKDINAIERAVVKEEQVLFGTRK